MAEVKESISSQSLHRNAEDTICEENDLPQEEEKHQLESQTDSDKHHRAANRGKPARKLSVSPSEEPGAVKNSQEKRDAISLAIKDIKEAIEEVKIRTVRSPYTPDEPKEPIWVMRQDLSPTAECDLQASLGGDVSTAAQAIIDQVYIGLSWFFWCFFLTYCPRHHYYFLLDNILSQTLFR